MSATGTAAASFLRVVTALRTIAPELPFEINCIELTQPEESFSIQGYDIHAFRVKHNVICYGYSVEIHRAGRFSVERAREQNVPMKLWSRLQKGETIEQDGVIYGSKRRASGHTAGREAVRWREAGNRFPLSHR